MNESKTEIMELLTSRNAVANLNADIQVDINCMPAQLVKSLGVIFDNNLNLEKHINKVVRVCYANLRNLGRIACKLSYGLKIQLVHSLILSHTVSTIAMLYFAICLNTFCTSLLKFCMPL